MDFDQIPEQPLAQSPAGLPHFDSLPSDEDRFGTPGQKIATALEGAAEGVLGPIAPAIEIGAGISTPENIRLRAETNPYTHGIAEAATFGGSMLLGTGEAALVGKAGEAASKAVMEGITAGAAKSALEHTGARIASGGAKLGSEIALMQAGDEATKAITQDPGQSIGSAVSNVGLSALLGGVGGGALAGLGLAGRAGVKALDLGEFKNRLGVRASGVNPTEAMQKELNDAYEAYHEMGSEVSGATGLKAQALGKIMPKAITPEIESQVQAISNAGTDAFKEMADKGVPERLIRDYANEFNKFQEVVTNPSATVSDHFDALNRLKQDLQDYSKGRWGLNSVQRTADDYQFINITKNLAHTAREALENPKVWGSEVSGLQKNLNNAWSAAIPAVKDMEKKFMSKVGNELVLDPQKFLTYVNQNGRSTSTTIKQQMMGKFVDALEKFSAATDQAYEKAGVPNPRLGTPIAMGELKHSMQKTSLGSKLADVVYDKFGAQGIGNLAGAGVGQIVSPGLGGAYIGKEVLGPAFGSMIKPIMEKATNILGFRHGMAVGQAVIQGDKILKNSVTAMIEGSKTIPKNLIPDKKVTDKLHAQIEEYQAHPERLIDVPGEVPHYLPNHGMELSATAARAVNYLSSQKPVTVTQSPLDTPVPPSAIDEAAYERKLQIAEQPLMVMHHISEGTLTPQDVGTLKAVYPDFYHKMMAEMTHGIVQAQSAGKSIPYHVRQGMSLFMGQPLDSTMLPMSVMAAQATFAQHNAPQMQQGQGKPKKSPQKMNEIGKMAMSSNQSREMRQNKV